MTNADLERLLDTNDEWIVTRTGMRERHIAPPEMPLSAMAVRAARHALERAALAPGDIDCFIVATVTPDYQFPATACIVAAKLGVAGKAAFDMEIACSGFVYGLAVASSLVRTGVFGRVMVIGAEKLSAITDRTDRNTAVLFGDGAGAAIIERSEADSFLGCELGSDGSNPKLLCVPGGGTAKPLDAEGLARGNQFIKMQGREIFRQAVTKMCESAVHSLAQADLGPADVAYMVPHQANKRIIDAAAKQLAIAPERVLSNIERFGNTSSASIPILLSEGWDSRPFRDGDVVLFTGFGGGLSWGSVAWRWQA
ncbi:MAG: beta-ketoacyl-ACP synthase III [Vulcanimicrobiaceae bacterium]